MIASLADPRNQASLSPAEDQISCWSLHTAAMAYAASLNLSSFNYEPSHSNHDQLYLEDVRCLVRLQDVLGGRGGRTWQGRRVALSGSLARLCTTFKCV